MSEPLFHFTQTPETFLVEEELLYPISGTGAFRFCMIEKRGLSTVQLKKKVSEQTGVPLRWIKHAGLKDRMATARQWLAWPKSRERHAPESGDQYHILLQTAHHRTLHIGHVAQNHFSLLVQHGQNTPLCENLARVFPNFYGTQRFANYDPDQPLWPERKNAFLVSQYQAALFNLYLRERWKQSRLTLHEGDLFTRTNGKRVFKVQSTDELKSDLSTQPALPTGPLPGYKMIQAETEFELRFLQRHCPDLERFRQFGKIAKGARRPLWVSANNLKIQSIDTRTSKLAFSLPSGSYATIYISYLCNSSFYEKPQLDWPQYAFKL